MADILHAGAPLVHARAAAVLVHGRGASAEDILSLADEFGQDDIAYCAPQAPGGSWYPYSFLAPLEQNEPYLSQALATVGALLERLYPGMGHTGNADEIAHVGKLLAGFGAVP